ncbi:MAG: Crp/Fnr family transcriptional regulator [Cellvibrionaceae bacterium]
MISVRDQLSSSGLFQDFPESAKKKLESLCRVQSIKNESAIYKIGDDPTALYGVIDGAVKLIGEAPTGKFFLYELVSPGQWFGENSAIDGAPRGQTAVAVGEVKVVSLLRKDLLDLLLSQPDLYQYFVRILCLRLRRAGKAIEETAFLSVSVRMAKTLLRMHRVREKYRIKLSQDEIAASLGVTRQSIYRVLKDWKERGWVTMSYGDVRIKEPSSLSRWVQQAQVASD